MWDDPNWLFGYLNTFLNVKGLNVGDRSSIKTKTAYWTCQILGWASYAGLAWSWRPNRWAGPRK